MPQNYIRYESIKLSEFVEIINKNWDELDCMIQCDSGKWVDCSSLRLKTFARAFNFTRKIACVSCGVEATYFSVESGAGQRHAHANLYGLRDNGEVLFTHDHVLARALGGKDELQNTQVMCSPCNGKKSIAEGKEAVRRKQAKIAAKKKEYAEIND